MDSLSMIINISMMVLRSAHLLQAQTDCLGALYWIDELALAHRFFDDVTKVSKVLEQTGKEI